MLSFERVRERNTDRVSELWDPEEEDVTIETNHEVAIEVRDQTTYHVDRSVTLKAKDPDAIAGMVTLSQTIEVTVGGTGSSYNADARPPTLKTNQVHQMWSRRQWELVKRLGDQAWEEYEKRFPMPDGST